MSRYTKTDVTTGDTVKSDINVQLGLIETAIANTLARSPESPNAMESDLDMNSNQILNLPDATTSSEPITLRQAQTLTGITVDLNPDPLVNGTTYQIGAGGDFTTINAAITSLVKSRLPLPNLSEVTPVILNLMTGFIMEEQVLIHGYNLGWIEITSTDAEVTISRASLLKVLGGGGDTSRPAFGGVGSIMPIINCLFTMDTSGSLLGRQDGLFIENGKGIVRSGAGFKNCAEVGIYANSGASIQAEGAICTGCSVYGFFAFKGSSINCQSAVADSCGQYGLYVNRASVASANSAQFNNCSINAVRAIRGSSVSWEDGVGTGSTEAGLYVLTSKVQALRANVSGSTEEGVFAHDGAEVGFRDGNANTCAGIASIWAFRGSTIDADGATATSSTATTAVILAQRTSRINFQDGDINTSTAPLGVRASEGSTINAKDANCQLGGSTSTADGSVIFGGHLVYDGATGGVGQTINTLAATGIIYQ
ncbi:MAG: hypothetical protein OCD76_07410 [Reichenbachiella sp.]